LRKSDPTGTWRDFSADGNSGNAHLLASVDHGGEIMSGSNQTDGTDALGTQAGEAVRSLRETATDAAEEQKNRGSEQLAGVAGAVHSAADELEKQLPAAADYVHDAAARIDRVASSLRDRNLSDLLEDVRRLAHDQPLAFFGGALVAGFAISRFFKSGQESAHQFRREETRHALQP
jgi:hypothetical protein